MANDLLASVDDINAHLPIGKAQIQDADDDLLQVEAHRLIRAKLAGTFSITTLAAWVDPTTTPPIIRSIAGRIIAAKWYAELYAEDSDEEAAYALSLYNEAMRMLDEIINGTLTVIGVDGSTEVTNSSLLDSSSFWPNDDSPKFTMDKEFA